MRRRIQTILHPAWYQGHRARPPYFEGWYFKLIDPTEEHRYAIIPGVFLGKAGQDSHAFVQVMDGMTGKATYHRYPVEAFQAAEDVFDVHIGPNRFTLESIHLQIASPEQTLSGSPRFDGLTAWPVTLISPGIMGPFAWVPRMECYHGVLSLDHEIEGALTIDGQKVDFTGGRGYIEKDWGVSFPAAWVWMQTNHFAHPGTSFTASIAIIPWMWSAFRGFIVGLWHEGTLYRFATYTGARVETLVTTADQVRWAMCNRRYRLEVLAHRTRATVLRGPTGADMGGRVPETLQSTVDVRLSVRATGDTIFTGTGRNAGMEIIGELWPNGEMT